MHFLVKNCLAIGLSANFLEPLHATSIGSVISQVMLFTYYYFNYNQKTIDNFNDKANKNMIMMFVLVNISIYQFVHTFRLMGNKTLYTTDKDTDVSNTGIFNIAILCLWQFYIYFLSF